MILKRCIATLLLITALSNAPVWATWSIIIIDPVTNKIGIAGASCSHNCYGIGGIVPGKGAIIVQAMSNKAAKAKGLEMMLSDASPEEIIAAIKNPMFDPENQQYAVVSAAHLRAPATYTGNSTHHYNGALTARGISVQGNTLANENEIAIILRAALKAQKAQLSIEEILMTALEAGAAAGGDKRCGEQKAASAFITVARPNDPAERPYLNLNIFGQPKGGQNAVELLRKKYDNWKTRYALQNK